MAPRTEVSDAERRQLQKLWAENPVGRTKLHAMARAAGLDITQRQVATFLKETPSHQLYLPQRKTKAITVFRRSRPLQGIVVDLTALPRIKASGGTGRPKHSAKPGAKSSTQLYYKWITVAIDMFSRYVWIGALEPMPITDDGSGPTGSLHWDAFRPILDDIRVLNGDTLKGIQVQTDGGNEMKGRFDRELKRRNIRHTFGKPGAPASQSIAERYMMTLKRKLNRYWRAKGVSTKRPWNAELLQGIVAGYNNSVHAALPHPYTPSDVMDALFDDPNGIIDKVKEHQSKQAGKRRANYEQEWSVDKTAGALQVGDVVRKRSVQPGKFDTQYSVSLFDIAEVVPGKGVLPTTYKLRKHGQASADIEEGTFTMRDLQAVPLDAQRKPVQRNVDKALLNLDDVAQREYEPQRIVAERGQAPKRRLLVRWRGYPPSAATWESEASMQGKRVLTEWDS
jgi:transposase InsO family protein